MISVYVHLPYLMLPWRQKYLIASPQVQMWGIYRNQEQLQPQNSCLPNPLLHEHNTTTAIIIIDLQLDLLCWRVNSLTYVTTLNNSAWGTTTTACYALHTALHCSWAVWLFPDIICGFAVAPVTHLHPQQGKPGALTGGKSLPTDTICSDRLTLFLLLLTANQMYSFIPFCSCCQWSERQCSHVAKAGSKQPFYIRHADCNFIRVNQPICVPPPMV